MTTIRTTRRERRFAVQALGLLRRRMAPGDFKFSRDDVSRLIGRIDPDDGQPLPVSKQDTAILWSALAEFRFSWDSLVDDNRRRAADIQRLEHSLTVADETLETRWGRGR